MSVFRKWLKRILFGLLAATILAMSSGFIYERISRSIAESNFSPQGELIDVGGHKLHFVRMGQKEDGPTVVFEAGADPGGHLPWFRVQKKTALYATTVSYDRAGILWSDRGKNPKTGSAIAEELHKLLEKGGFKKPYILVGHSLAGLTLRSFISQYAHEVSGVVFVDVSHPDQVNRIPEFAGGSPPVWFIEILSSVGVGRLLINKIYPGTRAGDSINVLVKALFYRSVSGAFEELNNLEFLLDEAAQITSFGDIPLLVVTGASPNRWDGLPSELKQIVPPIVFDLQQDLLTLSTDSQQILATKSGHYVQLEEPEVVVNAIKRLISEHAVDGI